MNSVLHCFLVLGIFIYFIVLFRLIKSGNLDLKYSLLWVFFGAIMFIIAIKPDIMGIISNMLGIVDETNGLFALMIFGILIILMALTSIVSKMKEKNRQLIQECSLVEKRLREIEKKIKYIECVENGNEL